jgi:membrane-bound lytic murein transglycosylase A
MSGFKNLRKIYLFFCVLFANLYSFEAFSEEFLQKFREIRSSEVANLARDDFRQAFYVWQKSCNNKVKPDDDINPFQMHIYISMRKLCEKNPVVDKLSSQKAHDFFESNFSLYDIYENDNRADAFFTGYYEPIFKGSLSRTKLFPVPLWSKPRDLSSLSSKAADGRLPSRREIESGALEGRSRPVAWVRDPVDAFMMQIQGSGAIELDTGQIVRLSYDGRNGWPYTSVGKLLAESENLDPKIVTSDYLTDWVRQNGVNAGDKGRNLLQANDSYIFLKVDESASRNEGPIGASGVSLTPIRSIAVDHKVWPYGLPFWVDVPSRQRDGAEIGFHHLVISQDSGSAIVGMNRVDIFFGSGPQVATEAGRLANKGRLIVLLPRGR